jgi:xylan 1,4-beta-xylosidase
VIEIRRSGQSCVRFPTVNRPIMTGKPKLVNPEQEEYNPIGVACDERQHNGRARCCVANILPESQSTLLTRTTLIVDVGQREPLRRIWRYVGYDECNYTDTPKGRRLLSKLGRMCDAPYFIRAHYLLCSGDPSLASIQQGGRPKWGATNVYTEDVDGNPVYDWRVIDAILDAILESGCVPFVELGFMPQALGSAPHHAPYDNLQDGGWKYPPRDYVRWQGLVTALAQHCLDRYGLRTVSRWYWELWNEPDLDFYWRGTFQEFTRLYDHTVAGLVRVLPQALIGGPATTNPGSPNAGRFLEGFLDHCVNGTNAVTGGRGTRLDFISFHAKGAGAETFSPTEKHTPTIRRLVAHVAAGLEIVARFPTLRGREIILSECDPDGWAAGSMQDSPNLVYRNTEYYASYVARAVGRLLDLGADGSSRVDGMLTWAFQFEGRGYFEGLRTLSTNDVDKPILNVFRLLARLGGSRLATRFVSSGDAQAPGERHTDQLSAVAAQGGSDEIQLLICCHHDDWDVKQGHQIDVAVTGLEPGVDYVMQQMVIDRTWGNSYTVWQEMGAPQQPTAAQLTQLKRAGMPALVDRRPISAVDGRCSFTIQLASHAVCLVELIPA